MINFLTSSINDATQQALNIITSHSMAGKWWVATGGGSSAVFPTLVEEDEDEEGLDKLARDKRDAAKQAARRRAERLDPEFPFEAMAFDLELLA